MAEHYTTELQSIDPVCDTHEPETTISGLGEIVEVPICVPRYDRCHTSIVATGKQGSVPGELNAPSGVAIQENTHQIFIAISTITELRCSPRRESSSISWV